MWSKDTHEWRLGGDVELGCDFKSTTPQVPLPPPFTWAYLRAELSLDLGLDLGINGWISNSPQYNGSFQFEPLAKGVLGAGVAKTACVEGYLGGGFHSGINFLPEVEWQNPYIILLGGVQAIFGPITLGPAELRFEWPEQDGISSMSMNQLLRSNELSLLPRDYLNYRYSQPIKLLDYQPLGTIEQIIESVVFPYSVPDVVRTGEDILTVYISDDTSRSLINRTELTYAKYSNGLWTTSTLIADDGTADLYPQLIELPDANAVCIWQDADQVLPDSNDLDLFNSHLDIAVSFYDSNTNTWSASEKLTNNSVFDRSPKLAAPAIDDIMAVWISNSSNDLWGSG